MTRLLLPVLLTLAALPIAAFAEPAAIPAAAPTGKSVPIEKSETPEKTAPAGGGLAGMAGGSKEPIQISAAKSLEWNRRIKTYIAHDDARARQGHFEVDSDTLTAYYNETGGKTDIYRLAANDHVIIRDPPYTAYGDLGIYEVAPQQATLTGSDLRIVTDTEKLTARDKIEFFGAENRLTATGKAVAVRGTDTLKSDVMNAYFQKDQWNRMVMHHVTAEGNVVIITEKETATGDHGTYDIPSQKAVLTGRVHIYQGQDHLEGTRADVDMNTGISKLYGEGNKETEGRVTGVFYPKDSGKQGKDGEKDKGGAGEKPAAPAPASGAVQ